jgi:uncharacterized protein YqjF (DUF2071 family)
MKQTWHDLLFAHWPLSPDQLRPLVPHELPLDTFDNQCWVGVVPFRMSGIRAHWLPPVPGLSSLPELNVRTYVTYKGKPGVYFFSLDAASRAAVWGARTLFHLPYFYAEMKSSAPGDTVNYSSTRRNSHAEFKGSYRPVSAVRGKTPLEYFLAERYCLYTVHLDKVYRCDIHHLPWPLQDAETKIERNTVAAAAQITLPDFPPLLHFAKRLDVLIWPLRNADESAPRV